MQKADETAVQDTVSNDGSGSSIQQDAEKEADKTDDAIKEEDKPAGEGVGTTAAAEEASFGPMVEVIEGKEGPNHEVVYKFNGEMFYVDREQQQIVNAEESNLKDAKDPAVIHKGSSTTK